MPITNKKDRTEATNKTEGYETDLQIDKNLKSKGILKRQKEDKDEDFDKILFERLRNLRKVMAEKQNLPPYIIFHDSTLKEMCRHLPKDREGMLNISGIGEASLIIWRDFYWGNTKIYRWKQHKSADINTESKKH